MKKGNDVVTSSGWSRGNSWKDSGSVYCRITSNVKDLFAGICVLMHSSNTNTFACRPHLADLFSRLFAPWPVVGCTNILDGYFCSDFKKQTSFYFHLAQNFLTHSLTHSLQTLLLAIYCTLFTSNKRKSWEQARLQYASHMC